MSVAEAIRKLREGAQEEEGGSVLGALKALRAGPVKVGPTKSFPTREAYYDAATRGEISAGDIVDVGSMTVEAVPREMRTPDVRYTPEEAARIQAQVPPVGMREIPADQVKNVSVAEAIRALRNAGPGAAVAPAEPPTAPPEDAPLTVWQLAKDMGQGAINRIKGAIQAPGMQSVAAKATDVAASPFKMKAPGSVMEAIQMLRAGQAQIPAGPAAATEPTAVVEKAGKQVKAAVGEVLKPQPVERGGRAAKIFGKLIAAPTELALGIPPGLLGKIEDAVGEAAVSPKGQAAIREAVLSQPFTPSEFQEAIGTEAIFGMAVPAGIQGIVNRFPNMALRFGLTDGASVLRSALDEVGGEIWAMPDGKSRFVRAAEGISPSAGRKLEALAKNMTRDELRGLTNEVLAGRVKFYVDAAEKGLGPKSQLTGPMETRAKVVVPEGVGTAVEVPGEGLPTPAEAAAGSARKEDFTKTFIQMAMEKKSAGMEFSKNDLAVAKDLGYTSVDELLTDRVPGYNLAGVGAGGPADAGALASGGPAPGGPGVGAGAEAADSSVAQAIAALRGGAAPVPAAPLPVVGPGPLRGGDIGAGGDVGGGAGLPGDEGLPVAGPEGAPALGGNEAGGLGSPQPGGAGVPNAGPGQAVGAPGQGIPVGTEAVGVGLPTDAGGAPVQPSGVPPQEGSVQAAVAAPRGQPSQVTPASPQRVRLTSTGPRTYTVIEQLPSEPSDLPGETFFRIKDEKTGELQVVEGGDLLPVKAKAKGVGKEMEPRGALPPALEERAFTGNAGLLDKAPGFPGGTPPATPAAQATEALPPAIEMPEFVEFYKELSGGKYPEIFKNLRPGTRGDFSPMTGRIRLLAEIFKDPAGAMRTAAHELFHFIDSLPDGIISRGNILARLASLPRYWKDMIEAMPDQAGKVLTPEERERIRSQLVTDLVRKAGKTMQQFIKDPAFHKQIAEQIPELYKRRLEAEAAKRGLITKAQVMAELKKLTGIWKPFDPLADPSYAAYRYHSAELYADAGSVLFNNPALLKQTAPTFYKAWFDYLERKPDVRGKYMEIIDRIKAGAVPEARQARMEEMLAAGERQAAAERLSTEKINRNIFAKLSTELLADTNGITRFIERQEKAGMPVAPEDDPRNWIAEMRYAASPIKAWLQEYTPILKDLADAGLEWERMHDVAFHQRVIGERGSLANPLGFTPTTSAAQLEFLRKSMGDQKWSVLMKAREQFRANWETPRKELLDSGMLSLEAEAKIKANDDYATFDVFTKHVDSVGGGPAVGAKIYGQIGTFQEISNVATATLMKGISIMKAVARNNAAKKTVAFLSEFGPEGAYPAEMKWRGDHMEPVQPADKDKGLIPYMEGGKIKWWVVDKETADIFSWDPQQLPVIFELGRLFNRVFRQIFTQDNPGFWPMSFTRDLFSTYANMEGASVVDVARAYIKAFMPAMRHGFDVKDPLVQRMLKNRELLTVEEAWGLNTEDEQVRALMQRYIDPHRGIVGSMKEGGLQLLKALQDWKTPAVMLGKMEQAARKMGGPTLRVLGAIGKGNEAISKIAGEIYYREKQKELGLSDAELARRVREEIGNPDYMTRGSADKYLKSVFMFLNPMIQGWRRTARVARMRPGEFWSKMGKRAILPKVLMYAAGLGFFGKKVKDMYDDQSEYDKSNYNVAVLGKSKNGKTVTIRVPIDDEARIVGGLFWKVLGLGKDKNVLDLANYMAGQAPSLNPILTAISDTVQYMMTRNYYDSFRGRMGIPEQIAEADDWRTHREFLKHLSNTVGGGILHRFNTSDVDGVKTGLEKIIGAPILSNILGRFLKATNYGKTEELARVAKGSRRSQARDKLDERDAIVASVNSTENPGPAEASHLYAEMIKAGALRRNRGLSVVPFAQFKENYERFASRRTADPYINALVFARSNEERAVLINYYRQTLSDEEYQKVIGQAMAGGHLTGEPLALSYIEEKGQ